MAQLKYREEGVLSQGHWEDRVAQPGVYGENRDGGDSWC